MVYAAVLLSCPLNLGEFRERLETDECGIATSMSFVLPIPLVVYDRAAWTTTVLSIALSGLVLPLGLVSERAAVHTAILDQYSAYDFSSGLCAPFRSLSRSQAYLTPII